jgi:hypothetical protein
MSGVAAVVATAAGPGAPRMSAGGAAPRERAVHPLTRAIQELVRLAMADGSARRLPAPKGGRA